MGAGDEYGLSSAERAICLIKWSFWVKWSSHIDGSIANKYISKQGHHLQDIHVCEWTPFSREIDVCAWMDSFVLQSVYEVFKLLDFLFT